MVLIKILQRPVKMQVTKVSQLNLACVPSLLIPHCCASCTELWSNSGVPWGKNLMYILCKAVHRAACGAGVSCSVVCVHHSCGSNRETMSVGDLQCLWGGVHNLLVFCLAKRRLKWEFYGHQELVEERLGGQFQSIFSSGTQCLFLFAKSWMSQMGW